MENSTFYPANDCRYLAHHGVKGMKWGVRRHDYEAKRKARYMDRYKITSKQYDSVREKSLRRHARNKDIKNAYIGAHAAAAIVKGGLGASDNVNTPTEALGYTIGVAGGAALSGIIGSAKYSIGRAIVDRIIEGREFSEIENKNTNRR